eukprot:Gb_02574 [translate_table: standard]
MMSYAFLVSPQVPQFLLLLPLSEPILGSSQQYLLSPTSPQANLCSSRHSLDEPSLAMIPDDVATCLKRPGGVKTQESAESFSNPLRERTEAKIEQAKEEFSEVDFASVFIYTLKLFVLAVLNWASNLVLRVETKMGSLQESESEQQLSGSEASMVICDAAHLAKRPRLDRRSMRIGGRENTNSYSKDFAGSSRRQEGYNAEPNPVRHDETFTVLIVQSGHGQEVVDITCHPDMYSFEQTLYCGGFSGSLYWSRHSPVFNSFRNVAKCLEPILAASLDAHLFMQVTKFIRLLKMALVHPSCAIALE